MDEAMTTAQQLREAASELRKVAAELQSAPRQELDVEKVRDFLIFFGGKK